MSGQKAVEEQQQEQKPEQQPEQGLFTTTSKLGLDLLNRVAGAMDSPTVGAVDAAVTKTENAQQMYDAAVLEEKTAKENFGRNPYKKGNEDENRAYFSTKESYVAAIKKRHAAELAAMEERQAAELSVFIETTDAVELLTNNPVKAGQEGGRKRKSNKKKRVGKRKSHRRR